MQIKINITGKTATAPDNPIIVCGNSDYTILFSFDSEWDGQEVKTARFNYEKDGKNEHQETVFTGNECSVPVLTGIKNVEIGVYAGDLLSTTPCTVKCRESILCEGGANIEPNEDVYNQIITVCNEAVTEAKAAKELYAEIQGDIDEIEALIGGESEGE